MREVKNIIDVSVWTGNWPFIHLRYKDVPVLENKLKSMNISKAYIAPIEGILEQDPMRANKALLSAITGSYFSPVPVIDLSYANWQECMAVAMGDGRVKMVKLIPNYHQYKLYEQDMECLVKMAQSRRLVISIQAKVEDPRAQYELMKVPNVNWNDVVKTLSSFPEQTFILHCLTMGDLPNYLDSLDNVYTDIASVETQDVLSVLANRYPLDKFLFASHCPFYFPEGNVNKLKYTDLDQGELDKIAFKNAERIFGL